MMSKTNTLDKIAILLFLVLMTLATLSFGGNAGRKNTEKNSCELLSFKAINVNNNVRLNWNVVSNISNYYFVLEQSTDMEHYAIIDVERGTLSENNATLQYSFVDSSATPRPKTCYRLRLHEVRGFEVEEQMLLLAPNNLFENEPEAILVVANPAP